MRAARFLTTLLVVCLAGCSPRQAKPVETIYLHQQAVRADEALRVYELRVPHEYLGRGTDPEADGAAPGKDLVMLWAVYPGMAGMSYANSGALRGEYHPNPAVHIGLQVGDASTDWAEQIHGARLRATAESREFLERVGETGGSIEYRYPNLRGTPRAAFITSDAGPVFVDCSFGPVCKARRSWRKEFTVRYDFDGSQIPDFQDLDRRVIELLGKLEYRRVEQER